MAKQTKKRARYPPEGPPIEEPGPEARQLREDPAPDFWRETESWRCRAMWCGWQSQMTSRGLE
jgi:hypothetical protein